MRSRFSDGETQTPKLISLFTGAGGLDIGLEDAGFVTLAANEIEPHACQTLRANKVRQQLKNGEFDAWFKEQVGQRCYKSSNPGELKRQADRLQSNQFTKPYLSHAEILEANIRTISTEAILAAAGAKVGSLELIAGGPPCQPFSRAGKRETVECETGRLFLEFVRIVREARPRWFLFENVKGLVISKTDVLALNCAACCQTRPATFLQRQSVVDNPHAELACPACRAPSPRLKWSHERGGSLEIILNEFEAIGYSCKWKVLNAADYGAPQIRERLFIVGSRDGETFEWPAPTHAGSPDENKASQALLFESDRPLVRRWKTMYEELWRQGHFRYGKLDKSKAVLWVKNVVRPHDEPVTWGLDRPSPTIGAHQGAKLALAPYGVPESQLKRQQWHVLGRRQGDLPPVPVEHEYLTDEELLRLQTFPVGWYLFGTRMQRAFQIGNAVPPVLARAVGESILMASGLCDQQTERSEVRRSRTIHV